jgi:hypothetical protein
MMPCSLVEINTRLGGNYCFHDQGKRVSQAWRSVRRGTAALRDLSEPTEARGKGEIIYGY